MLWIMRYRLFGRTGLRVSELLLGTMTLRAEEDARRVIDVWAGLLLMMGSNLRAPGAVVARQRLPNEELGVGASLSSWGR